MNLFTVCPSVYFDGAKLAIKNIPLNFIYSYFLVLNLLLLDCLGVEDTGGVEGTSVA